MGRTGKLRYGTVVAVGAAMTLVTGCGVVAGEPELETVLIGADLELSGGGSELGLIYENALRLRVEQVNQQGLLGDRRLELEVLDNRSDPAAAADNIAQFAADPAVTAIITGGCVDCSLAAVEPANQAGVPTISLAAASGIVEPVADRRYLFQLAPTAADNARVLGGELERLGAATIGLVTTGDGYGEEGLVQMREAAQRAGVEIVVSEAITADEDQLTNVAAAMVAYQPSPADDGSGQDGSGQAALQPGQGDEAEAQTGPDAVVIWAPAPVASGFAVALAEAGYEGQLLLDASAAGELFLGGEAGAALDGARMVFTETLVIDSVIASSPAKAARKTWFNDYTAREGTYHAHSSFAADAVQVIVAAINRFDSPGRESVRDAIENTQVDGFSGPIRIRLETHSGLKRQALVALVAQGDRWRLATN